MLISHSVYAETVKSSKKKSTDTNQTMSDDEFMKQFMTLDQSEKKAKENLDKRQKELEASKKLGKTLDEINQLIATDK
jgi:hypothetical protein